MTLRVRDAADGRVYHLDTDAPVGKGGEADIYPVEGDVSRVAKVYKKPAPDRAAKLEFMLANPPTNPTEGQNHAAYAWPTALIRSWRGQNIVGFLMPRASRMKEVFEFYNPAQRRQICAQFTYQYLMQTARNIAGIMRELHSKGYVVGDVNQRNILVSDSALVTVLDTDSFQFRDPQTRTLYLCRVRTDGFIAPEAYATGLTDVQRTVEQDLFGLGVLIFHLLMEGVHPFACRYTSAGEPPNLQQSVIAGNFPYGRHSSDFGPMPTAPPFDMLAPEVAALFVQCFVDGHKMPSRRPTAEEWQRVLNRASRDLVACTRNPQHYYGRHLGQRCPWCARTDRGLLDSFPYTMPVRQPPAAPRAKPRRRQPIEPQPVEPEAVEPSTPPPVPRWKKVFRFVAFLLGALGLLWNLLQ